MSGPARQTLFDIQGAALELFDALERADEDERARLLAEYWEGGLEDALRDKVAAWAAVIREHEARAQVRADEAERIKQLSARDLSKASRMRDGLLGVLEELAVDLVETDRFRVRIKNAGGSRALRLKGSVEDLPEEYLVRSTVEKVLPDKPLIKEHLAAGVVLDFAHLEPRRRLLVIS